MCHSPFFLQSWVWALPVCTHKHTVAGLTGIALLHCWGCQQTAARWYLVSGFQSDRCFWSVCVRFVVANCCIEHESMPWIMSCLWGMKWSSSGNSGEERRAADGVREPSCLMRSHLWHWVWKRPCFLLSLKKGAALRSISCSIFTPDFYSNISTMA